VGGESELELFVQELLRLVEESSPTLGDGPYVVSDILHRLSRTRNGGDAYCIARENFEHPNFVLKNNDEKARPIDIRLSRSKDSDALQVGISTHESYALYSTKDIDQIDDMNSLEPWIIHLAHVHEDILYDERAKQAIRSVKITRSRPDSAPGFQVACQWSSAPSSEPRSLRIRVDARGYRMSTQSSERPINEVDDGTNEESGDPESTDCPAQQKSCTGSGSTAFWVCAAPPPPPSPRLWSAPAKGCSSSAPRAIPSAATAVGRGGSAGAMVVRG